MKRLTHREGTAGNYMRKYLKKGRKNVYLSKKTKSSKDLIEVKYEKKNSFKRRDTTSLIQFRKIQ